ncbi:MAG: DUF5689 domain-containing protein [Saprospiraceae bacterium]
MKNLAKIFLPLFLISLAFNACIKEDFDQPPTCGTDPKLPVTTTIQELKALRTSAAYDEIKEDLIIKGVVVADDASGNWYKSFVLQDSTAGIVILIDQADSYVNYPRGREVYVRLKGLYLSDYNELIQLGGFIQQDGTVGPVVNLTDHLVKSVCGVMPTPKVKKISELTVNDVSTLVTLEGTVNFTATGVTFADAVNQTTTNLDLADCDGNTVIVRTSGFADFAAETVPSGGGTFTGVLSIFRSDYQFLIRDLSDLDMNGPRCNGSGGDPCNGGTVPTVTGVDEDFQSGADNDPIALDGWTNAVIQGSRSWQFKAFQGNIYAQATAYNDAAATMETWLVTPLIEITNQTKILTFESAQAFYTHAGLTAWFSTDFKCDPVAATWVPLAATLAGPGDANYAFVPSGDIDLSALIGQKVAIGFKYEGSGPNDKTGSYQLDNIKLGEGGNTGGNDPCQNGNPPLEVATLNEDFQSGTNDATLALTGWQNIATEGTRTWRYKVFQGNVYTQATAYTDTAPGMETWLITPLVTIDAAKTLSFETAKAFWFHDGLSIWISSDFECDQATASWQPLNATLASQSDADYAFVPSGNIDLSPFIGKSIAIGFKYIGNGPGGKTTTYIVDNVKIQ